MKIVIYGKANLNTKQRQINSFYYIEDECTGPQELLLLKKITTISFELNFFTVTKITNVTPNPFSSIDYICSNFQTEINKLQQFF